MSSPRPRVFISYSHQDKDLLPALVAQLKALEQAGLPDVWDDTRIDAGAKWYPEIEAAMQGAAVAVCLVSEYFLASDFCIKKEVPFLIERAEEDGLLLIPVLLSDCPWDEHSWVAERQMLPGEGRSVRSHFAQNPAAVFSKVAKRISNKLKDPNYEPPKRRVAWPELAPDRRDLTRLPETGAALFGRDQELQLLDSAWSSAEQAGSTPTRIVAFTANGGVGKSTLVNHWLRGMNRDRFRGATRVFGWSFYSQGVREEGMASADIFVDATLSFFGDPDPTAGSPWDKGERLARLVGAERALLVLDGLEPLQSGHAFERGKLNDPALQMMLRGLAAHAGGLCVITTREPLPDLDGLAGVTAKDLEHITPEDGRALLRTARVVGTDTELEELSKRFGLHALTVSLLGVYLHEKDPAHGTGPAQEIEQLPGAAPINRVLAGFAALLAGSAELDVLRLLGLFDRPADHGCLGALRAKPAIAGLTERAVKLNDAAWNGALARLEKLRLIHVQRKGSGKTAAGDPPYAVDAHPLLREHFAAELRSGQADAWRAAHRRLYEYLRDTTEARPDSLDGLQPLYQAVLHGCLAGLQQDAFDNVYYDRILRRLEAYSIRKLGAVGADLGAVACFFEKPWTRLSSNLSEPAQAWLLSTAAFHLRALGRLTEALEPMRAALLVTVDRDDWKNAASCAINLSELELALGDVAGAVRYAEQSVTFAERGDAFLRMVARATHANALHHAGRRAEALRHFGEGERLQAEDQPESPLLYSLRGFQYCDLLLADAERAAWQTLLNLQSATHNSQLQNACHSISERAAQTLKWVTTQGSLLDIALDHLTLGCAALYQAILAGSSPVACHASLDSAVSGLRAAGQQHELPRALLTRAWCRVVEGDVRGAHADFDEAWQIAERGSMKLYMADIHLHRARLFRDKSELLKARALIEACGYWRRKEELEDAEAAAGAW